MPLAVTMRLVTMERLHVTPVQLPSQGLVEEVVGQLRYGGLFQVLYMAVR